MNLTPYHAKYFAYELTKKSSSDSLQKLAITLVDAQVDINPHQVEAALFAFRSPLSKGAILADEVGLGKTIEAGLVISQKWAERKKKILVITPANLRKQWSQELLDKFFLPSIIIESKSFNDLTKVGNLNPFNQSEVVLCSYQFARTKEVFLGSICWDLVVIDEAHRLRNVYKTSNKIARSIKASLENIPKILLTATPLQNSLLELYGLVSMIDDYTFGDLKSFKAQYNKIEYQSNGNTFYELKERLKLICKRTLRRQVLEYIRYTNRIALVEEFFPTVDEQNLYDQVSDYLQKDNLYALPSSQRQLMTLILRRLLASSTYAISGTFDGLAKKLEKKIRKNISFELEQELSKNFESYDELKDEWGDNEGELINKEYTAYEIAQISDEIKLLKEFEKLAQSIQKNSKGEKLFTAINNGFQELRRLGANLKAIIFTESTRTQEYLRNILELRGFEGKIVLFNGTNSDSKSRKIYIDWFEKYKYTSRVSGSKSADMRAALVDYFRDEATIMIATEAASEGINLQFCSLVINYDLPWNPQRIEQRIGRCHRYGQKFDVVVVNFLNKSNAADQRVFELLRDKFKLFDGVFGSSDEVLGSIENGIDFEKRILQIYQECRTTTQIEIAFSELQLELESHISSTLQKTRQQLLENFDEEVHEKLRINLEESKKYLSKYETWLWNITQFHLQDVANFALDEHAFTLKRNPFPDTQIYSGMYKIGKHIDDANVYRISHPLAQRIIKECKTSTLEEKLLNFDYTNSKKNIYSLESLIGSSGWLLAENFKIESFEEEDYVLIAGVTDNGKYLDQEQCQRLFSLTATENKSSEKIDQSTKEILQKNIDRQKSEIVNDVSDRNTHFFELELEKLDKWSEDKRSSLQLELKELDEQIKHIKKEGRLSSNLSDKLKFEKERRSLENRRDHAWKEYDYAIKQIEKNKDDLIDTIEKKLRQDICEETLFLIKWHLK